MSLVVGSPVSRPLVAAPRAPVLLSPVLALVALPAQRLAAVRRPQAATVSLPAVLLGAAAAVQAARTAVQAAMETRREHRAQVACAVAAASW